MNYQEVEKYKVAVSISDQELNENNIAVDDILERSVKGFEYLRKIKESAVAFTGYEWPGCAYSMEMRVVSGSGIVVIFSETIADFVKGLKSSQMIADHGSILLRELIKRIEEADEEGARRIISDFERSIREVKH